MKYRTDYDSLYPGNILLCKQVLLQPFKIIIGPVHMVLSCPRQLEHTRDKRFVSVLFKSTLFQVILLQLT